MARGRTILESAYPNPPEEFVKLAMQWRPDALTLLIELIWNGCDRLVHGLLAKCDLNEADHELERSLTQELVIEINLLRPDYAPFIAQHERYEHATRRRRGGRGRQYDIAFVWVADRRLTWPIEAKVLRTPGRLADYLDSLRNRFLNCQYAPYSSQGAMLGLLFSGEAAAVFDALQKALRVTLRPHPSFLNRDHRTSEHKRQVPRGRPYPRDFLCHHLVLCMPIVN
jgi:hypothetical protein